MTDQHTRRNFLKTSVAAASAAATLNLTVAQSAHAAASDTIRIGVVGCGGRGAGAARDAMEADPGVKLVAMSDLFADRVQRSLNSLKSQRPDQVDVTADRCFTGLDGYKRVIENADVVLIACAAKFHPLYMKAAVDAGKHVFVEKPHAIDPVGIRMCQSAIDTAKQKRLSVQSGLHSRYAPEMKATIERVLDGAIGEIVSIEENFLRPPYGVVSSRPKDITELAWQYSCQYRFAWLCGDDVTQSLVHNLDRATWAMREQVPTRCHGLGGRSTCYDLPHVYGDVFDHHTVVYHYANGVRLYALCRTTPGCYNEDSSIIMGSRGIAYPKAGRIDGPNKWRFSGANANPYVIEHQHLYKAIRSNEPWIADYLVRSTMVAVMGQLSCYSGREITWEQAMKSEFYFPPKAEDCTWDMEPPVKPDEKGIYPVAIPGKTRTV